ncbi:MAG: DUF6452 family protein [Bacteroidales bacterium]
MNRKKQRFIHQVLLMLLVVGAGLLPSCQQDELCEDATQNPVGVRFYSRAEGNSSPATLDSLTVYGVGLPDDSIYANQQQVQALELLLDSSKDSTGFVLVFPQATDTIWLNYQRHSTMISVECGFMAEYTLLSARFTDNLIDTLAINNSQVTNIADEHLQIFIPAATDPDPEP